MGRTGKAKWRRRRRGKLGEGPEAMANQRGGGGELEELLLLLLHRSGT
jgi:hypothetical protein